MEGVFAEEKAMKIEDGAAINGEGSSFPEMRGQEKSQLFGALDLVTSHPRDLTCLSPRPIFLAPLYGLSLCCFIYVKG